MVFASFFCEQGRKNFKSLNDAIRAGPKLQRDILNVLIRSPIALSGDISEMFLQVGLLKGDRVYHRDFFGVI